MTEKQEGARLRFDPGIGSLGFHANNRSKIVRDDPRLEKGLLRLYMMQQLLSDHCPIKRFDAQLEVDFVLLNVGQV